MVGGGDDTNARGIGEVPDGGEFFAGPGINFVEVGTVRVRVNLVEVETVEIGAAAALAKEEFVPVAALGVLVGGRLGKGFVVRGIEG